MSSGPVLIIDDDPAVLRCVGNALHMEGYEILTAENGQSGLDLARERSISLILLDIGMPVMDGVEFLEQYCGAERPGAPVVVLSGRAEETRWQGMDAVLETLPKPFTWTS